MVVLSRVSGYMSLRIVSACNVENIRTEVSKCSLRIFLEAVEHGACEEPSGEAGPAVVVTSLSDCKLAVGMAAVAIAVRRGQTSSSDRRASWSLE